MKKRLLSLLLVIGMLIGMIGAAGASGSSGSGSSSESADSTYKAPTEAMEVDDSIITASAHRAASPILGILGVNAVSGYGMIIGSAPDDLEAAEECAALGIWGSSLNENPDPYYWNYFYNFYAEENGLELAEEALLNGSTAGSPSAADTYVYDEYGGISISLYARPDILVGIGSTGYDAQLETIASFYSYDEDGNLVIESEYYQDGDEDYDPKLVAYETATIADMMDSVQALADAIDEVAEETGKTTRYGDVQDIAADYVNYVYALIAYVHAQLDELGLEEKTFACVRAVNDDGTVTISGADSISSASTDRPYEYASVVGQSLSEEETAVTVSELMEADVIIDLDGGDALAAIGVDSASYDGMLITACPDSLYGMTLNSVENAMGYAYIIACMYCDVLDLDPVESCAYFYENFYHVTDTDSLETVVTANFSGLVLPEGLSTSLDEEYSSAAYEAKLLAGIEYYEANEEYFDASRFENCGMDEWEVNYENGIAVQLLSADTGSDTVNDADSADSDAADDTADDTADDADSNAADDAADDAAGGTANDAVSSTASAEFTFADDDGTGTWTWAGDYIYDCYEAGIINGYEDGTYLPDNELTRAEAAKIIALTFGLSSTATESTFSDVSDTHWALKYIEACVEAGIINGYTDGTFLPGQNVTRAEMAKMIAAACGLSADASAGTFSDVLSSHWALQYIEACYEEGIITGYTDGTFLPGNNISRAEAATIISRVLTIIEESEEYLEAAENYNEVCSMLSELFESSGYVNSEIEEQVDQLLGLLEDLAAEGAIQANSVAYDEDSAAISFRFADGAICGISLAETEDGTISAGNTQSDMLDSYVTGYTDTGFPQFYTIPVALSELEEYPYEEMDLSVLVLWGCGTEGYYGYQKNLLTDIVDGWNECYLSTDLNDSSTVESLRTGLSGYDYISIMHHGVEISGQVYIGLEEKIDFEIILAKFAGKSGFLSKTDREIFDDLQNHRITVTYTGTDVILPHIALAPSFFTYYYGDNGLDGTIVFLGACSGYKDDSIVSAIAACGADAVLGCTEDVSGYYEIYLESAFVYSLLCGYTVEESLTFAQSVWGENDQVFIQLYEGKTDTSPSEFRIYNGGDATLVTLTQEALDSLAETDIPDDAVASGTCGTNLTWVLTDDGTLTISGRGAMYDWSDASSTPWYSYRTKIKTLIIGDSVTSIGEYAFSGCKALKTVTVGDNVTAIGNSAFAYCVLLTSILIPDGLTSIGSYAFYGCVSLTSFEIPDSMTGISSCVFYGCTSLTSILIPDSVTTIGYSAFEICTSLTYVYYTGSEENWDAISISSGNTYLTSAKIRYNYTE